jgi:hypothetical protein
MPNAKQIAAVPAKAAVRIIFVQPSCALTRFWLSELYSEEVKGR